MHDANIKIISFYLQFTDKLVEQEGPVPILLKMTIEQNGKTDTSVFLLSTSFSIYILTL